MFDWRRPFYFLAWCVAAAGMRLEEWFYTRQPRLLVGAVPALLVVGAWLALLPGQSRSAKVQLIERYNRAIEMARQANDLEAAELFLHKLLQLDDTRADVHFRLALLAEQRGETEKAQSAMIQLAPDDGSGHAAAHLWRAQQLLSGSTPSSEASEAVVIRHLQAAQRDGNVRDDARALLGQFYLDHDEYAEAAAQFSPLVNAQPRYHFQLAKSLEGQGNKALAERSYASAIEHLRRRLLDDELDVQARLQLSEAQNALGKNLEAEETLLDGLESPSANVFRQALADLYVTRFDSAMSESPADPGPAFDYLQRALALVPDHEPCLARMTRFTQQPDPIGQVARRTIQEALASGRAAATLHLLLGTQAAQELDFQLARMHLNQAKQLNPAAPVVLNNLAWVLAQEDESQLPDALRLATAASRYMPDNPLIHQTCGQILAKMQRWPEALTELELALNGSAGNAQLHATLAEVYEQLGDAEMAKVHAAKAEKVSKPAAGSTKSEVRSPSEKGSGLIVGDGF